MEKGKLGAATIVEWLEEKLDSKNPWCANSIRSQLTKQMIEDICMTFPVLPIPVKLKTLLSIFRLPRSRVQEWQTELEELLKIGVADKDQSIAFLAEILQPYPSTGGLFTELENLQNQVNRRLVEKLCCDVANEVSSGKVKNANELNLLPLECYYFNRTVLERMLTEKEPRISHFRLKNKTKAQIHRDNLINANGCAAKKPRYSTDLLEIPVRMKMNPRKISDTIRRKNPKCTSHEV